MESPLFHATAWVRMGDRTAVFHPWHKPPEPRPDVEAIDAGYAADCVDLWFPLDDYHLYFTRLDLGDLYERTTGYYGDLWSFTTEELRNWLARALAEGEVLAYWWDRTESALTSVAAMASSAGIATNVWAKPEPGPGPPPPWPAHPPSSFEECEERLAQAKARIETYKYWPKYTDAELIAIRDKGGIEDRFIVWVTTGTKGDSDSVGFCRASGRSSVWTAPFSLVEDADLDAEFLCAKNGMPFWPDSPYSMVIVDRSVSVPGSPDSQTFFPTYERMTKLGIDQFEAEGSPRWALTEAMTKTESANYEINFERFSKSLPPKTGIYDESAAEAFANTLPSREADLFYARWLYHSQFGCNSDFLGTGFTRQKIVEKQPGTTLNKFGAVETFTFEKRPPNIGSRKAAGAVRVLHIPPKIKKP